MYLSHRTAFIRNLAVAGLNGAITLIILLIAPMGLAGVIINTSLVTIASFLNATMCDRIVRFLQPNYLTKQAYFDPRFQSSQIRPSNINEP